VARRDVPFGVVDGGQDAEAVRGPRPIFGFPSRSERAGAGHGAEGWWHGSDEDIGGDPEQPFPDAGAVEDPADGVMAEERPVMVNVPPVCTCEVRGAVRRDPRPRQLREGRRRRIANGRRALRRGRDVLRAKVEDLVTETSRLESVARSTAQVVDGLLAKVGD
jgi:hypothetical protein